MGATNDDTAMTTRRTMLAGAGAAGVAATLAACGTQSDTGSGSGSGGGGGDTSGSGGGSGGGGTSIKTSEIPVNGGKVFQNTDTVVTQPAAGTFKAFTATCTHMGCTVESVKNNTIHCACHGSNYNASDGSVKNGPATQPLAAKNVTVSGDTITVS